MPYAGDADAIDVFVCNEHGIHFRSYHRMSFDTAAQLSARRPRDRRLLPVVVLIVTTGDDNSAPLDVPGLFWLSRAFADIIPGDNAPVMPMKSQPIGASYYHDDDACRYPAFCRTGGMRRRRTAGLFGHPRQLVLADNGDGHFALRSWPSENARKITAFYLLRWHCFRRYLLQATRQY